MHVSQGETRSHQNATRRRRRSENDTNLPAQKASRTLTGILSSFWQIQLKSSLIKIHFGKLNCLGSKSGSARNSATKLISCHLSVLGPNILDKICRISKLSFFQLGHRKCGTLPLPKTLNTPHSGEIFWQHDSLVKQFLQKLQCLPQVPYVSLKSPRKIDKMVISEDVSVQVDFSHNHLNHNHPSPPPCGQWKKREDKYKNHAHSDAEDHNEVRGPAADPGEAVWEAEAAAEAAVWEGADGDAETADGSSRLHESRNV